MLALPFDRAVERQKEGTRSRRETAWGALFCGAWGGELVPDCDV